MALAANAEYRKAPAPELNLEVVNAAEMYGSAYVAAHAPTHGTAALRGRVFPYNDQNFAIPLGFSTRRRTGNTAANPIPSLAIAIDRQLAEVPVAGTASREDNLRMVYGTDDNTFTITRPALGHPIGIILNWITGTTCRVYFFSLGELVAVALAGAGKHLLHLGVVAPVLGAAGDLITGIVAPYHGLITSIYATCIRAATDVNVHMDIQAEIGGTNTTGGIVTLDFADAVAAKKAGTAITGLNEMHEGDLIDVEALAAGLVAGTATDVGEYNLYAEVQPLPGH